MKMVTEIFIKALFSTEIHNLLLKKVANLLLLLVANAN